MIQFLIKYVCNFCYNDMQSSTNDNDDDTESGRCSKQFKGA